MKTCSVHLCNQEAHSGDKGLCKSHVARIRRYGDVYTGGTYSGSPEAFLRSLIGIDFDSCILWPFAKGKHGHGQIYINGRLTNAHRFMLMLNSGAPDDETQEACHDPLKCNNRGCVNPNHLRWASHHENMLDKFHSNTQPIGEKIHNSILTESSVKFVRKSTLSNSDLAKMFGVAPRTIRDAKSGRTWKHVT